MLGLGSLMALEKNSPWCRTALASAVAGERNQPLAP
jgi:hypothetical protein